jgi:hypothetical protein
MSTPERFSEAVSPPEQTKLREQVPPEEPAIVSTSPVQSDQRKGGQVTPVASQSSQPDDQKHSMNVPARDQKELEMISKGNASKSSTWYGVSWIRRIRQALLKRIPIVFKR